MTKKELKIKINDIIDRKQRTYIEFAKNTNNDLQTKELMSRIDAELVVFSSIFDALNGNNALINCY